MDSDGLHYAAFISYRHIPRDRTWAIRIMRALEGYCTPRSLRKEAYPARIGRLFRDEDEIPASSDLSDQIKNALSQSAFLIVVCSPDTPGSRWVRREIQLFQEMGRGGQIIPLLIAGEPEESFPPELLRRRVMVPQSNGESSPEWQDVEPIAADVRPRSDEGAKSIEHRAVLRLAAALLRCRFDDLAQRELEQRRHLAHKRLAVAGACCAIVATWGAWWWDAHWRIKVAYCSNYALRWEMPSCVGPLTPRQQARRETSYRLLTRADRVFEVDRINGEGWLKDDSDTIYQDTAWTRHVARWDYTYNGAVTQAGEPKLASVMLRAASGRTIRTINYQFTSDGQQAVARFERIFGTAEWQSAANSALDVPGEAKTPMAAHSDIGQNLLRFDTSGHLVRRFFQPAGGGDTVADSSGAYGQSYQYNQDGLTDVTLDLDSAGQPFATRDGVAGLRLRFNGSGNLISVSWLGEAMQPVLSLQRIASVLITRDDDGNVKSERYQDALGQPAVRFDTGVGGVDETHDERGNDIREDFVGIDQIRHTHKRVAHQDALYDEKGNWVELDYFDSADRPVVKRGVGAARVTRRFDSAGNRIEEAFFGTDGKPVLREDDGISRMTARFDEDGNRIEEAFFGPSGDPVRRKSCGCARIARRYDQYGNEIELAFFGTDGKPTPRREASMQGEPSKDVGPARETIRYDRRGNEVERRFFGVDGKPAARHDWGVFRETTEYDERGDKISFEFLDGNGNLMLRSDSGVARASIRYDDRGNEVELHYFDTNGKLVLRKGWGAAGAVWRRDQHGNMIEEVFLGLDGKPLISDNFGTMEVKYDERGRRSRATIHYLHGNMTLVYNGTGKIVARFSSDAEGKPVQSLRGAGKVPPTTTTGPREAQPGEQ